MSAHETGRFRGEIFYIKIGGVTVTFTRRPNESLVFRSSVGDPKTGKVATPDLIEKAKAQAEGGK